MAQKVGLAHEKFSLTLDKVIEHSGTDPTSLTCEFSYIYDFPRNLGYANLLAVNGAPLGFMFNLGIAGQKSFMCTNLNNLDIISELTSPALNIYIYRTVMTLKNGERMAMIMLGEKGDTILATQNWPEDVSVSDFKGEK
jgi:hypothetical protein